MNRLLEIGFQPAGHWLLEEDQLRFELARHSAQKNILYAFVCDGEVKYVGKTTRTLAARMAGYKRPGKTQMTNINNHRRIRELLAGGVAVEIFALPDNGLLHYGRFHLNLAAALEDDIIRTIDPEWNGGRTEPVSEPAELTAAEDSPTTAMVGSFAFTLQPTYFRSGFFNVGVSSQGYLGAGGETVELFLGGESRPVLGTINRRANTNATPRVMGGTALRDWFHANASVGDSIGVEVCSPTSVRLTRSSRQSAIVADRSDPV